MSIYVTVPGDQLTHWGQKIPDKVEQFYVKDSMVIICFDWSIIDEITLFNTLAITMN